MYITKKQTQRKVHKGNLIKENFVNILQNIIKEFSKQNPGLLNHNLCLARNLIEVFKKKTYKYKVPCS